MFHYLNIYKKKAPPFYLENLRAIEIYEKQATSKKSTIKKEAASYKNSLFGIMNFDYASTTSFLEAINKSYSSCDPTIIFSYSRRPVPAGIKCPTITFSFNPFK